MLPFTPEQTAMLRDDTPVGLMLAAHHPGKPAEYPDAVKTLVELRKYTTRKTYILKLLEANNRVRLGQTEEALQLFGKALDANPVLGGAYKDLGDLLMMRYDSARAWRSWDIGRRIAPKLQIFDEVTNYEAELVKRHPEYF
jgi:tetratricopeptide (TPR) repeat protein